MKARVSHKNENAPATPRQIRWVGELFLLRGVKRPTRKEMDDLIRKLEAQAGAAAVSRLRKRKNAALKIARALKRKHRPRRRQVP